MEGTWPASAEPLPPSGAWREDVGPGQRRFLPFALARPMVLEGGGLLSSAVLAYETWGRLDADGANALLICHALTGDSHVIGDLGPAHPTAGWWEGMVGPGCHIDTDRWFVVCANVLGGCQGTTGPASPSPEDGRPYGPRFPVVSVRDMVRTQALLADHLGVAAWASVVGGSMGGMQALEWAVTFPDRVRSVIPIAASAQATTSQIALEAVMRDTIRLDPRWRGGDYYDAEPGDGPQAGLAIARMLAQITYRTEDVFADRFGRELADPPTLRFEMWQRFEVERYLEYHGAKLVRRFDANSYLALTKAMSLHDVGRRRGGLEAALARVRAPLLSLGVSSDRLFPTEEQRRIAEVVQASGGDAEYAEVDSPHGHDGFLIEVEQVGTVVASFLERASKP